MRLPCVKPSELDSAPLGSWPGGTRETSLTVKGSEDWVRHIPLTGSFDVASAPPGRKATAEATMDANWSHANLYRRFSSLAPSRILCLVFPNRLRTERQILINIFGGARRPISGLGGDLHDKRRTHARGNSAQRSRVLVKRLQKRPL